MKILMFGIYDCGLKALESLVLSAYEPVALVTKPASGPEIPPIIELAQRRGIRVIQPESPALPWFVEFVRRLQPDLAVVAGYHKRIPCELLTVPVLGTINVHGSLLPRYRGPSTWKQAIMNGETATGVTVHVMTPEFDNGDILIQQQVPISEQDTGGSLFQKLCLAGAEVLPIAVKGIESKTLVPIRQQEEFATYYGYVTDSEAAIDWSASAQRLVNLTRALNPRPGAWASHHGIRYRIGCMKKASAVGSGSPGSIVQVFEDELQVRTGTQDVLISGIRCDSDDSEISFYESLRVGHQFDLMPGKSGK